MPCRLCREDKQLVEAHIVAKCILKPLFSDAGPLRSISKDVTKYPRRLPTGVYDKEILCSDCDSSFSPWEEYTADLLYELAPKHREGRESGFFEIPNYDYSPLKLCVLSSLWRMSITKREEYEKVALGALYEETIRNMLIAKNPGPPDTLSVAWLQLTDYVGSRVALGTQPVRHGNSTIYNVGLPGFVAVVKVGKNHFPHPFQSLIMMPERPLVFGLKKNVLENDWRDTFQKMRDDYHRRRR